VTGAVTGPVTGAAALSDELAPRPVLQTELLHSGMVFDLVADTVDLGDAGTVRREWIRHPGAVGVLALDDDERVLLVQQYRHPVQHLLWELPAGLLDVPGELPVLSAQRELAEEADLRAERWDVLVDWYNSPGGMDEAIRVFLARDVSPVPHDERFERFHEEAGMPTAWLPLDDARDAVLAGRMHNPTAVVGILAACAAREKGWTTLRPADAPWPEHKAYR
jgi:ADP-ribose pyrophosphatase